MSEKAIARTAGPQAGQKTKLRIKRNKSTVSQPTAASIAQSRILASRWVANVNKRIFSELIPPPRTWATAPATPSCPPENHVGPAEAVVDVPDDQAGVPGIADPLHGPTVKWRRKCPAPDTVPAAPSLDQQQIAALQQLNSKLRERIQASEAANVVIAKQMAHEQSLREDADAKAANLQKQVQLLNAQLRAAEDKLQDQSASMQEMRALHTAMEMRVGIVNPAPILSSRDSFVQQKQTAERLYTQFEEAQLRSDADDPAEQHFNGAAAGVLSGLQAAVLLVHAGAHEFQTGAEKNARAHITAGRGRIKQAEKWLGKVGHLTCRLKAASEAAGATLPAKERTRRSIFTQGASVLEKRVHTLAEAEYLCCERISVNQTTKHANLKQSQQTMLRERLKKQKSPESDASCADVLVDPGVGTPTNMQVQELFDFATHFNQARKRLEATVDIAIGCVREGPRLSADLLRFFKWVERVDDRDLAQKGRAIGWTMAAVAGEFGLGFNANVGTLQRACEILRTMLPPSNRGGRVQARQEA
eukprot:jgi/Ulvmu1/6826/UM031_0030.1